MRFALTLTLITLAGQAAPAAPGSLHATLATKAEVHLAWQAVASATGYIVESLDTGRQWKPIGAPVATTEATLPVTPFATYTLRVRATAAGTAVSPPSNEITVGPPPTGFHGVTPFPKGLKSPTQFAAKLAMALDDNGDPAFAYTVLDPNNDAALDDSRIEFVSWSRARYQWNAPVAVGVTGDTTDAGASEPLSLALDATTHRLGIAYVVAPTALKVALSADGGATWQSQVVSQDDHTCQSPSLGLANGRVHLAYTHRDDGVRYRTGMETEAAGKWTSSLAPVLAGTRESKAIVSLAVDSADQPAVIYLLAPEEGYNQTLVFWRPGSAAVKAADSNGFATDEPFIRLSFRGTQPAIVMMMKRSDRYWEGHDQVWVTRATDTGAHWTPPVALPNDGGNSMGFPASLAMAANGRLAVNARVDGGNQDGTRCGQPKVLQSTDGIAWTICSPGSPAGSPATEITEPQLMFAANDRLYLGFVAAKSGTGVAAGVILWREP